MSEKHNLLEKCKQNRIPYMVTFELTPFCNFDCNMCYIHLTKEQADKQGTILSTQQWINIASQSAKMGALLLEMTGGEVLTRSDFKQLYCSFIKMGYLITVRTNAFLINDDIISLFVRYKPRLVQITMYGASNNTYQKVCGISNGFSVVSKNIENLINAGINVKITMTETVDNTNDKHELDSWAKSHGLELEVFNGLINPIRGADRDIHHLFLGPTDEECTIRENMVFREYVPKAKVDQKSAFSVCNKYGASFSISWDGRMMGCNALTSIWEDPLNKSVECAFHMLLERMDKMMRPKECHECIYFSFCPACPVKFESATGDPEKCSEELCRLARKTYIDAMRL